MRRVKSIKFTYYFFFLWWRMIREIKNMEKYGNIFFLFLSCLFYKFFFFSSWKFIDNVFSLYLKQKRLHPFFWGFLSTPGVRKESDVYYRKNALTRLYLCKYYFIWKKWQEANVKKFFIIKRRYAFWHRAGQDEDMVCSSVEGAVENQMPAGKRKERGDGACGGKACRDREGTLTVYEERGPAKADTSPKISRCHRNTGLVFLTGIFHNLCLRKNFQKNPPLWLWDLFFQEPWWLLKGSWPDCFKWGESLLVRENNMSWYHADVSVDQSSKIVVRWRQSQKNGIYKKITSNIGQFLFKYVARRSGSVSMSISEAVLRREDGCVFLKSLSS